jgi:hypothetical protein
MQTDNITFEDMANAAYNEATTAIASVETAYFYFSNSIDGFIKDIIKQKFNKLKHQFYLDKVIARFKKLNMSCEEYFVGGISNDLFLNVGGIYMILDTMDLEFAINKAIENNQIVLIEFLERKSEYKFNSCDLFVEFYKKHSLNLLVNNNLKGLSKTGIFENNNYNNEVTFIDMADNAITIASKHLKFVKAGSNDIAEYEFKKLKRKSYLNAIIEGFKKLNMSCEEVDSNAGEISSFIFLVIEGIFMIIDYTDLEFSESRNRDHGQEILIDFLKNNPKLKYTDKMTRFINIQFKSCEHFERFYKTHSLNLLVNNNLKGLNRLGIFEIKRFKDFSN